MGYKDTYTRRLHIVTVMVQVAKVPRPKYAKPGANPTLETIEYVLAALQKADGPVSRNRLLATLGGWGHSTTRQSLNAAASFLGDQGTTAEGSKGLICVPEAAQDHHEAMRQEAQL